MYDDIFLQLNQSQREAVAYCDGPQLVIAGAGAGKTRVLTHKVAYLLRQGYNPWNILALTFTNKAAGEMKERVASLVGSEKASQLHMGTFHSVFARVLRAEAGHIGYSPNFTIYDQGDSRSLVKKIIKEKGLDEKTHVPARVADKISMAKNHLTLPAGYSEGRDAAVVRSVYQAYVDRCRQSNAMDFDDLLLNTYLLFKDNEDIRRKYAERFLYVLVDEYQDTNYAQQAIVSQLTRERQCVCAVGDDAQSIYGFRGAEIDNILNFTQVYDGAKVFKLEQNYRSTKTIVAAANSLIGHNQRQIKKDVFSENEQGEKLSLRMLYSDREEAAVVCGDIARYRKADKCRYGDFAILYRTNSQSRSFEEELRKRNIPYHVYGGLSFYQRKEIKDIIAYFRLVVNPNDEEAFRRVVNYPARGIGSTTMTKIAETAAANGTSLWDVAREPASHGLKLSASTASKLTAFCSMVEGWAAQVAQRDANLLGSDIIRESGVYKDIYQGSAPEDVSRQDNLVELFAGMDDFVAGRREEGLGEHATLADFLQEVALLTDLDSDADLANDDKVSLMTIHSAKGLEFPTVFVVGLEENIFPSPVCANSPRELEEERRLFYVAITRAERRCVLTCAESRFRYGKLESSRPSRFISDIDPKYVEVASSVRRPSVDAWGGRASGFGGSSWGDKPEWQQNPHPVASQFKADPIRREVPPRREPAPSSPFSDGFATRIEMARRGMKPVRQATPILAAATAEGHFKVGDTVEHKRFGIGRIVGLEGTGENLKAAVEFTNVGTKNLLLKFAQLKLVES